MRPPPAQASSASPSPPRRYSDRVQQQMPELVRRREDPALHRNPVPGVDHHRGSAVARSPTLNPKNESRVVSRRRSLTPWSSRSPLMFRTGSASCRSPTARTNCPAQPPAGVPATRPKPFSKPERTARRPAPPPANEYASSHFETTARICSLAHEPAPSPEIARSAEAEPASTNSPIGTANAAARSARVRSPWDDRPSLDLPQRHPRDPGPGGQLPLRQLPVQP